MTLFAERVEKVNKKRILEKEITDQNSKLTRELQAIFKPLAIKSKIGFHLIIKDEAVEVSTQFHITRSVGKKPRMIGDFRMCLITIPIESWMLSTSTFGSYLSLIETNLRYLNYLTRKNRGEGKISFTDPNTVTISINTRNRYF